jgi:hypothetical protein
MSDIALEAHEHAEHAAHAAHEGSPFTSLVSITIALLAVVAAIAASLETVESSGAIIAANEAVLAQDKATDTWAFFQAKSLKKHIYGIAADQGGPKADEYKKTSKKEGDESLAIQNDAKKLEAEREHLLSVSQIHEARHHRLTIGATLLEIGIAISTIAIITRRRLPWIVSGLLGIAGMVIAATAYVSFS